MVRTSPGRCGTSRYGKQWSSPGLTDEHCTLEALKLSLTFAMSESAGSPRAVEAIGKPSADGCTCTATRPAAFYDRGWTRCSASGRCSRPPKARDDSGHRRMLARTFMMSTGWGSGGQHRQVNYFHRRFIYPSRPSRHGVILPNRSPIRGNHGMALGAGRNPLGIQEGLGTALPQFRGPLTHVVAREGLDPRSFRDEFTDHLP
jgi:hypothetical protein